MLRGKKGFLFTIFHILCYRWDRMGLRSPLAPIQALPWTWRPDSCHPLGTLCPAGASMELRKKTPLPLLCRLAEGRETNGGTPECLFPFLLLPSHKTVL